MSSEWRVENLTSHQWEVYKCNSLLHSKSLVEKNEVVMCRNSDIAIAAIPISFHDFLEHPFLH